MRVLIVEPQRQLASIWSAHLERCGASVTVAASQSEAIDELVHQSVDVVVLNLLLPDGSAFAVADFASYRHPTAKVIFVTNTTFFSDGSIFQHSPNACAFIQQETPPEDLAAMVEHYAN